MFSNPVQEIRQIVREMSDRRMDYGTISAVTNSGVTVKLGSSGGIVQNVRVMGGTEGLSSGDTIYLLYFSDQSIVGLTSKSISGIGSSGSGGAQAGHNHDGRYYTQGEVDTRLRLKADYEHDHSPPRHLSAQSGNIGGWDISTDRLVKDTDVDATSAGMVPAEYPFYAGATYANRSSAPFRVSPSGELTATSASISGSIAATSGSISGDMQIGAGGRLRSVATGILAGDGYWLEHNAGTPRMRIGQVSGGLLTRGIYWDGSNLQVKSPNFEVDSSGNVTMTGAVNATSGFITGLLQVGNASPNIIIDGSAKRIRSSSFIAGSNGFSIDAADGSAEFNNLLARGEIRSAVFTKQEIHAVGGTVTILPSALSYEDAVVF